jgi:hypothetical protein
MPDIEALSYEYVHPYRDVGLYAAPFLFAIALLLWFWTRSATRAHRRREERAESTFGVETCFHGGGGVGLFAQKSARARERRAGPPGGAGDGGSRDLGAAGGVSEFRQRIGFGASHSLRPVVTAVWAPSWFRRGRVHLDFRLPDGAILRLTLILRDPQGFLAAVREPVGDDASA